MAPSRGRDRMGSDLGARRPNPVPLEPQPVESTGATHTTREANMIIVGGRSTLVEPEPHRPASRQPARRHAHVQGGARPARGYTIEPRPAVDPGRVISSTWRARALDAHLAALPAGATAPPRRFARSRCSIKLYDVSRERSFIIRRAGAGSPWAGRAFRHGSVTPAGANRAA